MLLSLVVWGIISLAHANRHQPEGGMQHEYGFFKHDAMIAAAEKMAIMNPSKYAVDT
jgi:hypothetical protein